ncbi:LysR family transcriptional regulator [Pararhodospirillum photometricum]|uniref:Transcriptional regulator, LysR family n=1 Tax=Pararhodospirillum photometricum DSM 122 TaxID=1150469 RepID=H6SJR3_PARPM|nr:LysR family transcriptional regulator [Pararhodospirillum photometricum]CCG08228.1 Transcriptional regulator, LysR family [Pararhodospirillum photometricum DSM 122]
MRRLSSLKVDDERKLRLIEARSPLGSRIPLASLMQMLAVAEHLNFRHAANALGVSQSSISTRIKLLEQNLGILLFERLPRGVRLTEAGRHFVDQVAVGIDHLDHAVKTAGLLARGEQGHLRISAYALISNGFLAGLLNRYREQHPDVDIEIAECRVGDAVKQVRDGHLDVAFVLGTPDIPDCHSRPIWTEQLMIALPASHPLADCDGVTWGDLSAETFLIRHSGTGPQLHDLVLLRLAERWPRPSVQRFDVDRLTLISMVEQGYGVTLATKATSQIRFPGVVFLPVLDEPGPVVFSAVWSPNNRAPALRHFLDLAKKAGRSTSPV